jgi:hypothetical protein
LGAILWLFILLVFVPTALYGADAEALNLAYLFVLNLVAGYSFWARRKLFGLGRKSTALVYLASGICFFAVLVEPVKIDSLAVARLDSAEAWAQALRPKPEPRPSLAGSPVEQKSIDRKIGNTKRTWLTGVVEDVVLQPEEPR